MLEKIAMSQNLLNDYIINQTRQLAHLNKLGFGATHQQQQHHHHQSAHIAQEIGNEVTLLMSDIHHHHHHHLFHNFQQQQQQQDNTLTTQDHFGIADEMPQQESDNPAPAEIVSIHFSSFRTRINYNQPKKCTAY